MFLTPLECPLRPLMEYSQPIGLQALHRISTNYAHFSEPFASFVLPPTTAALKFLFYLVWAISFSKLLRAILAECYPDLLGFLLEC